MKEKELRLALVCYGGVSLAVYMHGVTKEFQKLVRASSLYHRPSGQNDSADASYDDLNDDDERETDTERVYFDLLCEIGQELDLRVFIDVIAGASAGGINGVMLARALAHDLPLDAHRKMWLEKADITALMDEEVKAKKWSKAFLRPLFWGFTERWLRRIAPDLEMREKLSTFTRSRWFSPPFSGQIMSDMLLDACHAMGEPRTKRASLLPMGHQLDLFVSVTDFYGYEQTIPLDDPPSVQEREHRHILKFQYLKYPDGGIVSDFNSEHIPGLVFAARATSSFPGAFPPVQINEIDRVLGLRGEEWLHREEFIAKKFKTMIDLGSNPLTSSFIDGSVLNNKPFAEAVNALTDRPAYREVDRRIIYIDPDPESGELERAGAAPGFFQTIRGALSDIPRNEPVRDELAEINVIGSQIHLYHEVVRATRPHIQRTVAKALGDEVPMHPTAHQLSELRKAANTHAARDAGYAYDGYIQIKVLSVLNWIAEILGDLAPQLAHPSDKLALTRSMENWARAEGIFPVEFATDDRSDETSPSKARWVTFLRRFDVNFRRRRLRFVIRRLNELYENSDVDGQESDSKGLDEFKVVLYGSLERLQRRRSCSFFPAELHEKAGRLLADTNGVASPEQLQPLLDSIRETLSLIDVDTQMDDEFSILAVNFLPPNARAELIQAYLSFPFFDVLTFPLLKWKQLDDIDTVLVARISPPDATALQSENSVTQLRGRELGHFGAFFSKTAREHDYLWGRLHSAERLVDFVVDSASTSLHKITINADEIKGKLFQAILKNEGEHLTRSDALLRDLAEKTENLLR
jgi:patatin-related protein